MKGREEINLLWAVLKVTEAIMTATAWCILKPKLKHKSFFVTNILHQNRQRGKLRWCATKSPNVSFCANHSTFGKNTICHHEICVFSCISFPVKVPHQAICYLYFSRLCCTDTNLHRLKGMVVFFEERKVTFVNSSVTLRYLWPHPQRSAGQLTDGWFTWNRTGNNRITHSDACSSESRYPICNYII